MGFGHRVYKNYDPRARIIKKHVDEVLEVTGTNPLLDIAVELEKRRARRRVLHQPQALPERRLLLGPDLPGAAASPPTMFTVIFAIPRDVGLGGAVARDGRRLRAEDRAAPPDLHRRRPAGLRADREAVAGGALRCSRACARPPRPARFPARRPRREARRRAPRRRRDLAEGTPHDRAELVVDLALGPSGSAGCSGPTRSRKPRLLRHWPGRRGSRRRRVPAGSRRPPAWWGCSPPPVRRGTCSRSTLSLWIMPPSAAGTKTSHGISSSSSPDMGSAFE